MSTSKGGSVILKLYFALVSFVTLMMLVFSVSDLINISLKTFVFTEADTVEWYMYDSDVKEDEEALERRKRQAKIQKQQDIVRDISMLIVAAPIFLLHFKVVQKDWRDSKKA